MINLSKIVASSKFAGLKNFTKGVHTYTTPASTIPAASKAEYYTSIPLINDNAISNVRMSISEAPNDDSELRPLIGGSLFNIPDYQSGPLQVLILSEYRGGSLWLTISLQNLSGSSLSIPAYYFRFHYRLFLAPFD